MRQIEYGSDASSVCSFTSVKLGAPKDVMTGADDSSDDGNDGCELEFDYFDQEAFLSESDPASYVLG